MIQSVSFILPVRDVQDALRARVQLILEVLEELTESFDVLIVDYGSRDETPEVAWDLVREFPQVDFLDRGRTGDFLAAIEAGLMATRGEVIFVHDIGEPLALEALRGLWQMRDDDDLVMAQSRASRNGVEGVLTLPSGRRAPRSLASSIQMIRRQGIEPLHRPPRRENPFTFDRVTRTDLQNDPVEAMRLPKLLSRLRNFVDHF